MKVILAILTLIALVSPMLAMPYDMMNNTNVCKIGFDTGSSFIGIFAWHNLAEHTWEVIWGVTTYQGTTSSKLLVGKDTESVVAT